MVILFLYIARFLKCGTGKYLQYLKLNDFQVAGADSSQTAVEMTKENIGQEQDILCADMFTIDIKSETYDLILSVSTIHHGMKNQVKDLIRKIHTALVDGGKIFITLPDYQSAKDRDGFTDHEEVESQTYIPLLGPEKGLPHSFYTKENIEEMFNKFKNLKISIDNIGRWLIIGEK